MMAMWGRVVATRARYVLLLSVAVVLAAGVYGVGVFGSLANGGFADPDSEAARELTLQQEVFGNRAVDVVAIYSSDDLRVTEPAFRSEVGRVVSGLPDDAVTQTVTYYQTQAPRLVGADGHATQVLVSLTGKDQDAKSESYEAVEEALRSDRLRTDLAGQWAVYDDVNEITSKSLKRAEMYSLPIVLVLSLLIFGSVVAALMPVMVGGAAVLGALAVVRLLTLVTDVSVFSINIITLLGMGLAIDYGLFIVSRFREELARQPSVPGGPVGDEDEVAGRARRRAQERAASAAALRTTMTTAGRTVLFSGLTVAAALSSLLVFPQNFLQSMGYGGIAAVLVAMLAALTLLPATLLLLGRRIDAGRVRGRRPDHGSRRASAEQVAGGGAWARIAHNVMRHPVAYLTVIVLALVVLASPLLGVKWGSVDYRVLPEDAPAHVAAEKLHTWFGPETSTANVMLSGADRRDAASYADRLGSVDGVTDVRTVASSGRATLIRVTWQGTSQSQASQDLVRDLRAVEPPGRATALVGGLTAQTVDLLASLRAHLPWMGLVVAAVMLVLLFVAFGSVVLPLKAVAMNVVSIAASFGVVTWIFAEGHLEGLLGFQSPGYLDATQPILMLAILFGLSMDYEVFLLSRIREEWDRSGDNAAAVAAGLQRTGGIITSAALLLAVVIGAFSTSGILFMKMIGVGMLVALLLDATVVRALLVPATMKLLGRANWWAPGPLRRWWERYGVREEPAAEQPSAQRLRVGS